MPEGSPQIDYRALVDGLGQGILLFDAPGHLLLDNWSARHLLGRHMAPIRDAGWPGLMGLVDALRGGDQLRLSDLHEQALRSAKPVRFDITLAGAVIPCWVAAIYDSSGTVLTLITLERPDWRALTEVMAIFRAETQLALSTTQGHAELVRQILRQYAANPAGQDAIGRMLDITGLIATHMLRLQRVSAQLHRLAIIRTGELKPRIRATRCRIWLADFFEDFLETLTDDAEANADLDGVDLRERLAVEIPQELYVFASPEYLANALRDTLRNAACYSPPGTPIRVLAYPDHANAAVQIDIIDLGYGIRATEHERIFAAFQRAHQPQIIGVEGYGLSLHLTRTELEAMRGHIWYASVEGQGSTFSLRLPYRTFTDTQS